MPKEKEAKRVSKDVIGTEYLDLDQRPSTKEMAAQLGLGSCNFSSVDPEFDENEKRVARALRKMNSTR